MLLGLARKATCYVHPPTRILEKRGKVFWENETRQIDFRLDEVAVTGLGPCRSAAVLSESDNVMNSDLR